MIASDFKDSDGFKLQFEEGCSESDKKFFIQQFPKVDNVKEDRVHCTTCDAHIGTAPISEKIVRTHQVLGVTQCNKCFAFYNSGEFGKGEDGSEYYCRWCGQGGEVFCCSTCPFVFCNKCIRSNLTSSYVKEIEETDDWSCFVCDKSILKKHRAQHWALRNYMNKQLEKIQKIHVNSEDELNNLLNEDTSMCCPRKKRKSLIKPAPAPIKRPSMNGFLHSQPPAKKPNIPILPKTPKPQIIQTYRPSQAKITPVSARGGKSNDEIVCTPDIMGLFNDNDDTSIPLTNMMPTVAPPPLVMRNSQQRGPRTITPAAPTPTPIYHNVSGYQIDLNHAARQEIFRLPNGKLIQVRKQTGPPSATPSFRPGATPALPGPRGPQFTIRQANPVPSTSARAYRAPVAQVRAPTRVTAQPQTRFTFADGRVVATPQHTTPAAPTPAPTASTVFTQQNGSISVARAPQPNTPFGKAKTEFEDKIISGMEICQHTINKMITLTNSTSFKTSRNFKDLKDLYIHLQYLFSYTSGKFKTLQESLTSGMESLAKHEPALKDKADDDELEIVEQKTDVIEVLSDDDEPPKVEKAPVAVVKKPLLKHIQYTKETDSGSAAEVDKEVSSTTIETPGVSTEISEGSNDAEENARIIANDKKLKNRVMVKVEKLEESEDKVVQQYMAQLKQRFESASPAVSRESTPETSLFEPVVVLAEKENSAVVVENVNEDDDDDVTIVIPDDEVTEKSDKDVEMTSTEEKKSEDKIEDETDDVILIPSQDTSATDTQEETKQVEGEIEEEKQVEEENLADVLKIDDVPPVELMEIDNSDVTEGGEVETEKENDEKEKIVDDEDEIVDGEEKIVDDDSEIVEDEKKIVDDVETPAENSSKPVENSPEISEETTNPDEEDSTKVDENQENIQVNGQDETEEPPTSIEQPENIDESAQNGFKEATNGAADDDAVEEEQTDFLLPLEDEIKTNGVEQEEITKIADEIENEKAIFDELLNEFDEKSVMEID